jgi:hypothetical protein
VMNTRLATHCLCLGLLQMATSCHGYCMGLSNVGCNFHHSAIKLTLKGEKKYHVCRGLFHIAVSI